jgi:hypothetical protein
MSLTRRAFIQAVSILGVSGLTKGYAGQPAPELRVAVKSPWMANQVALTGKKQLFLGLPRYAKDKPTPSLAKRSARGQMAPFPGNHWNEWQPGKDPSAAFVYLNSVHIFEDDTVWCVDQGSLSADIFPNEYAVPAPGAQKLVQLDPDTGEILSIIRFTDDILPAGAQMNDLRFHGKLMFISDSGLGGIIIHDLASGFTLRRLSAVKITQASDTPPPAILSHLKGGKTFHPPNSDMIEITADGKWLYWASPTGPLYRVETRLLTDRKLSDDDIIPQVETVYQNHFSGGCAMDSAGNIYFSETVTHNITVLAPSGETRVLLTDNRLIRPDGSFISHENELYIPVKVPEQRTDSTEVDDTPFVVYAVKLPAYFEGIPLGGAI